MTGLLDRTSRFACTLAVLLIGSGAAVAQTPPPAPQEEPAAPVTEVTDERIQDLIQTLRDPGRREALLADLEALLAVRAEAAPEDEVTADDVVGQLLGEITDRTAVVRQVTRSIVRSVDEVPELIRWLEAQLMDPRTREVWLGVGFRVALVLGIGTLVHLAVRFALRGARQGLTHPESDGVVERFFRTALWLVVELLPVAAFTLAAYASLAAFDLGELARRVVVPLINAVIIVRSAVAVLRVLLAAKHPRVRLLPINDAAASYATRWLRRLAATAAYGYFALEAARHLGLPWALHGFLLHILFFVVTVMAITMIVRARDPVAEAIASLGEEGRSPALRRLPWATLGSLWHVLAVVYVAFTYLVWALRIPGGFQVLIEATIGSLLVVAAGWLLWRLVDQIFRPQEEAQLEVEARDAAAGLLPRLDRRVNRYLPMVGALARALVVVAASLALLEVWGFGTLRWLFSDAGNVLLGHMLTVVVIIVFTLAIWELISLMIERSISDKDAEGNLKLSNRTRTLLNITRNVLLVFLSMIALFMILSELGLDIAPLLAGAGVIGLAIGFGSQKLVQDIITGLFVLLGDTIRVGDVVEVAGRAGVVEEMSMRTVALRDLTGSVHTIPYSAIDTVKNLTKDFSYAMLDLGVAYRESVDQVIQVLRDLGDEMNRDPYFRRLILEPLEVLGVDAFADSAVIIKVRFKTRPLKQWEVGREFRRRIKNRFDELGIEIPYPHQTVYFGADKRGSAAPARVALEGYVEAAGEDPKSKLGEATPEPFLARTRGG